MARIRPETPADHDAVNRVHRQAFGQLDEADLVEQLRRDAHPHVSLVAEVDGTVVGHIFFSPVELPSPERSVSAMGLAPMAVLPEWQRQGIGAQLVREGLAACRRRGVDAVVVLGHPDYYPRFGFRPAAEFGLRSTYDGPTEAFMALELTEGGLRATEGVVTYHPTFGSVE
jgi:putative acetyltransferase